MIEESLISTNWHYPDSVYIKGLSESIELVSQEYIWDSDNKKYHIERVFSYELYHKWRQNLKSIESNPENLMLNAELTKHYDDKDNKFPDMVLHGDYTDHTKQFIICEIKSSRNFVNCDALRKDIKSLSDGIIKLGYHCGAFIYLGGKRSQIHKRIIEIMNELNLPDIGILLIKVIKSRDVKYDFLKIRQERVVKSETVYT